MTEEEWLVSRDPAAMVEVVRQKASDRKLALLAIAWVLRGGDKPGPAASAAKALLEEFDSDAPQAAQTMIGRAALMTVRSALRDNGGFGLRLALTAGRGSAAQTALIALGGLATPEEGDEVARLASVKEVHTQADYVRDLFGNPFRPVAFDPAWRSPTAVEIGRRIYEERDFPAMPVLADALQDAGCEVPEVLEHCRSGKPHVRGCWVLDRVLAKD